MDVEATKLKVIQKLTSINAPELLSKINALIDEEMVVGYTTNGLPLTKAEYDARLKQSERDIEKGRTTTSEDLKNRVASWKTR